MEHTLIVKQNATEFKFGYRTRINYASVNNSSELYFQSIDIILWPLHDSLASKLTWHPTHETRILLEHSRGAFREVAVEGFGSIAAFELLTDCLKICQTSPTAGRQALKLVVPYQQGHVVRSDIISLRMVDCPLIRYAKSFPKARQYFKGRFSLSEDAPSLEQAFSASAGGVFLLDVNSDSALQTNLATLDGEFDNRLSFGWTLPDHIPKRTLARVEGVRSSPETPGIANNVYESAKALGIDMVILDDPGHWVEDPKYTHWRKAFVPFRMKVDETFATRIVEAVRESGHHVNGIHTGCDMYMSDVARAAELLSLPTPSPRAFEIATDKHKTSVFSGHNAHRASTTEAAVALVESQSLKFPLIIKPCNGWSSEGVSRVDNLSDLVKAINAIDSERHGKDFVLEDYVDGPEVDANFILCDGEVLFFEVSDDFPKGAESHETDKPNTWHELDNVLPSALPREELDTIRDTLHEILLHLGFRTGFYHLEARLRNSGMEYSTKNDILELSSRRLPQKESPSAWLIEINPRPPGIVTASAVAATYGVDYFGIAALLAVGDTERARILSQPFRNVNQYWSDGIFIPADRAGIFDSDDVCAELSQRRPDLAAHISRCGCLMKRGEQVPHPASGLNPMVAFFVLFSRESRRHLLEISKIVRRETRFCII